MSEAASLSEKQCLNLIAYVCNYLNAIFRSIMTGYLMRHFRNALLHEDEYQRAGRRERVVRDRTNPLDYYNDLELYQRYRLDRQGIITLTEMLEDDLRPAADRNQPIAVSVQVSYRIKIRIFYYCREFRLSYSTSLRFFTLESIISESVLVRNFLWDLDFHTLPLWDVL